MPKTFDQSLAITCYGCATSIFTNRGKQTQPPPREKRFTHPAAECVVPAALEFMRDGFPHQHVVIQGGVANVFFGRASEDIAAMKNILKSID